MKHVLLSLLVLFVISTQTWAQDAKEYDEGITKFRAQDYAGVIDVYSKILENPSHNKRYDEDLYFYRGQSYFHKAQYEKSLADLNQSETLNHFNKGTITWYKARCYDKLGKTSEAKTGYQASEELVKNKKTLALLLADRAQFYARMGDQEAANKDLAQAKTLDPANAEIAKATTGKPVTPPSRGDESKKTQVIVKTNPNQQKPSQTQTQQQIPTQTASTPPVISMIPALGELYKDEKRYALVIGNSNYSQAIGILKNPVNDATDVATELRKSNFEVQLVTNATYVQLREAMRKFHENLTNGPRDQTVGLFYYAGHGVQYQDENYLVPIDADVKYEDDIVRMCFPVQNMVLANMERSNSRMNIIILDACRNNPFPATSRSMSSGLGEMKRAKGSFIAYATSPGSVASDGSGRNGLYTQELLKALKKSGLTIEQVFKDVRMNVLRLSGEKQYTWDSSNIIGEFYFKFQ